MEEIKKKKSRRRDYEEEIKKKGLRRRDYEEGIKNWQRGR
jgi:hypothetical protein